jgi:hypothetical protein
MPGATKPKSANIHGFTFAPDDVVAVSSELLEAVREVAAGLVTG